MSVYQPIKFNIVVIFSKRIYEHLSYLQPAHVETELKVKITFICKVIILILLS